MRRTRLVWAAAVVLVAACGSSDGSGGSDSSITGDTQSDTGSKTCDPKIEVPWLVEGNFWTVAWSEIDISIGLFAAAGDYDLGSYVMKLGPPTTVDGVTMFELQLSGDTTKHAPLWDAVGTDGCGTILVSSKGGAAVPIYSLVDDVWSGRGFWTTFAGFADVSVNRNASLVASQYTKKLDVFDPPLTSVGVSDSETGIGAGTGCDYFPGYGTLCGSDDPGGSRRQLIFEYWDDQAGPVAYHYAYDYDEGGALGSEKHAEQRVEVWFFGDVTAAPIFFENEPDTYAAPTPLPVSTDLLVAFGEINAFDFSSGEISGFDPPPLARDIHDWYSFEITEELAKKDVDFYLAWDHDVELGFYLFTAPDNVAFGFQYLDESKPFDQWEETQYARSFSGKYAAGKYLLGVRRMADNDIATQYGVFSKAAD